MKEFQISRYIKKWLPLIVCACAALTAAVYFFLSSSQTYVASAVIRYEGDNALQGLTPTGEKLNVEEIKSSAVVSKVIGNLGLDSQNYSVDSLISGITITEVVDADEQARKEALLEEGQEYEYEPITYIVTFEAGSHESKYFAREVLDEVLDVYFSMFSEKYVNSSNTVNPLNGLENGNYDYIEVMELIDGNIEETIQAFNDRMENSDSFRATSTGMTFADLSEVFYYIQSVEVSDLFSKIFENQVTKDKELLIAKYKERINNNEISGESADEKLADVEKVIDAYVDKMRESGNTDITYEYILDEVYDKDLLDKEGNLVGSGDQTVTYDNLIYSWRDHRETKEYAIIDTAYCNYVIDVFSECLGFCGGAEEPDADGDDAAASGTANPPACSSGRLTCAAYEEEAYAETVAEIDAGITKLISELDSLYQIVDKTNAEYNEYMGAAYISTLSSVSVEEGLNVELYTAIAFVFLMVICCCGAILIGRLNDIIQYTFYTDVLTGLNNRSAFDAYIKREDKKVLDNGTVCATVEIMNQPEINRRYGRKEGDSLIQFFAETLRACFVEMDVYLVYNGKAQFVAVVEHTDATAADLMLQRFQYIVDHRENLKDAEIVYKMGMAEAQRDEARRMRILLSKAIRSQKEYRSVVS